MLLLLAAIDSTEERLPPRVAASAPAFAAVAAAAARAVAAAAVRRDACIMSRLDLEKRRYRALPSPLSEKSWGGKNSFFFLLQECGIHRHSLFFVPPSPERPFQLGDEMASTLSAYNTRDSPFLDLDSPFTAWYASLPENSISLVDCRRKSASGNPPRRSKKHAPSPSSISTSTSTSISTSTLKNREALKLVLLSPLIIPRCLGALAACTVLACMSALAAWDWPESTPLSTPRRALTVVASKLAGVVLWSLGFSVRVRGREHLKRALKAKVDRPILIFNHVREEEEEERECFLFRLHFIGRGRPRRCRRPAPRRGARPRGCPTTAKQKKKSRERKRGPRRRTRRCSTSTTSTKKNSLFLLPLSLSFSLSLSHSLSSNSQVSWADAPLVMYLAAASGVSRASNKDIPLIGTCIRAFQNIYVERAGEGGEKKKKKREEEEKKDEDSGGGGGDESGKEKKKGAGNGTSPTAAATAAAPSSSSSGVTAAIQARVKGDPGWPNLILAPEGTCGDGKCLLRFRTGAFVPGAPVLPILLRYENRRFNPAWGIVADERIHFVRALCQFRKRVDVLVLPPYRPSEAEKRDAALFAANVRKACAEALGLPMRDDQGYEEFAALLKAGVSVSADGRRVVAPAGVVDEETGLADLTRARERRGRRSREEEKKDE